MTSPSQLRQTRTYVELGLSQPAYDEIRAKLREAGYEHAFGENGAIDLHGLAAVLDPDAEPRVQLTISTGVEHLVPVHPDGDADWDTLYRGTTAPWPTGNEYEWKRVVVFDAPTLRAISAESIAAADAEEAGPDGCNHDNAQGDGLNGSCPDCGLSWATVAGEVPKNG